MLSFTTLASGSAGNAALVSCGDTHILLDAGVSALQIARLPDVLTLSKAEEDVESLTGDLCAVLEEALAAYQAYNDLSISYAPNEP